MTWIPVLRVLDRRLDRWRDPRQGLNSGLRIPPEPPAKPSSASSMVRRSSIPTPTMGGGIRRYVATLPNRSRSGQACETNPFAMLPPGTRPELLMLVETPEKLMIALIRDKYIDLDDPFDEFGQRLSDFPLPALEDGGAPSYRLRTSEHHREILEDFILRRPGDPARKNIYDKEHLAAADEGGRIHSKGLIAAYKRLSAHLDSYLSSSPDQLGALRQLQRGLFKYVTFVVLDMKDLDDAFVLFETLNQRGAGYRQPTSSRVTCLAV